MNIIYYVDFKSPQINKDFSLSNALIEEHTVLLVTNDEQLRNSIDFYDVVLIGVSMIECNLNINKKSIKIQKDWGISQISEELNK